jgi:hypothetical protein
VLQLLQLMRQLTNGLARLLEPVLQLTKDIEGIVIAS